MSTELKFRRGTKTEHVAFTGAAGEVTVDTTNNTPVVHDGLTIGGHNVLTRSINRAINGSDTSVIFSTDTTTVLDDVSVIYSSSQKKSYIKPDGVGASETIVSVVGNILTTNAGLYDMAAVNTLNHMVSLSDFGVLGDGSAGQTPAIQQAIDYCILTGDTLYTDNGVYLCESGLVISGHLHILAPEWEGYATRNGTGENIRGKGAYFYRDAYEGRLFTVTAQSSVVFENVAFDENQPTPATGWSPTEYGWNIFSGSCEDLVLKNVFFRKCYRGVRVDNSNGGAEKLRIDGLFGQNLGQMIDIDFQSDVNRINNLHAWPYWSLDTIVRDYTRLNAEAIVSGRNDNPLWSNIFTIAQRRSIRFKNSETSQSGTVSNKVHLSNADLDVGETGIYVDADVSGVTLQGSNVTLQGHYDLAESRGMDILGSNCRISISNFRSSQTAKTSVRIEGSGNEVSLDNAEFQTWGGNGTTAAIAIAEDNTLKLGHNFKFIEGLSSTRWSLGGSASKVIAASGDLSQLTKDTDQVIPTGVATLLEWQLSPEINENAEVDLTLNTVAPKVPGLYKVNAVVQFASSVAGSFHELRIVVNGSDKAKVVSHPTSTGSFSMSVEKTVRVIGGAEAIAVRIQQNTGADATVTGDARLSFFEVTRVG